MLFKKTTGVLNISSSEVVDKKDFILELVKEIYGYIPQYKEESIHSVSKTKRSDSIGLDTSCVEEMFEMLDTAIVNGICIIDTARAYGTAEIILGNYFASRKSAEYVKIISKLRPNIIEEDETDICGVVRREWEETLNRFV